MLKGKINKDKKRHMHFSKLFTGIIFALSTFIKNVTRELETPK